MTCRAAVAASTFAAEGTTPARQPARTALRRGPVAKADGTPGAVPTTNEGRVPQRGLPDATAEGRKRGLAVASGRKSQSADQERRLDTPPPGPRCTTTTTKGEPPMTEHDNDVFLRAIKRAAHGEQVA